MGGLPASSVPTEHEGIAMMCARSLSGLLFGLLLPVAFSFGEMVAAAAQRERTIRPSDVVFMYDNPKMYEPYGCTVLGWAGWGKAQHIETAHRSGVRHFSTSIGFLTEFRRVIDFSDDFLDAACRNLAGEPFIVPWLWDHKHKQQPAWWWCTNSPLYRKYLDTREAKRGPGSNGTLDRHSRRIPLDERRRSG